MWLVDVSFISNSFWIVNLFIPCSGALLSVTAEFRINILTNSYAFGNMLLPNFYCPPKEIRALCILGKNTLLKYSYFHGCVCVCCVSFPWWQWTKCSSVEQALLSPLADSVSVQGIPVPGPNPQALGSGGQGRPSHTLSFSWPDSWSPCWRNGLWRRKRGGPRWRRERARVCTSNLSWELWQAFPPWRKFVQLLQKSW